MSIHNLTQNANPSSDTKQEFIFSIDLTPENREWIIATAKNTKKYRNEHGSLVLVPLLLAELAEPILRPCLRFERDGRKIECYGYFELNNGPMKAGYWKSTFEENIIICNLFEDIRQVLQSENIELVNRPFKQPQINSAAGLLKEFRSLQIRPKWGFREKKLLNTKFGTFNVTTKQWQDANPDDELLGLDDLCWQLYTMADVEQFAEKLEAAATAHE
jgi:hypothetical protein